LKTLISTGFRQIATLSVAICLFMVSAAAQEAPSEGVAGAAGVAEQIAASTASLQKDNANLIEAIRSQRAATERLLEENNLRAEKRFAEIHGTLRITAYAASAISAVSAILSIVILLKITRYTHVTTGEPTRIPATPAPTANPAIMPALARIEERLNALAKNGQCTQKSVPDAQPPGREILEKLNALESTIQNHNARNEAASASADAPRLADALWPKPVRTLENYPIWRKTLANAAATEKPEALRLASSLLAYRTIAARREQTAEECAGVLHELSLNLYAYCYSLDTVNEEDRLDAAAAIFRAVKEEMQQRLPTLEIKAFHPNDRLNTDAMEKVDSGSRLTVSKPLSWLLTDRSSSRERILHRAKVITG
jgi:hypothetical protein